MNHLGVFAGEGGFELAAKLMGWKTVAWCEWDPFCQQILKYYFPNAEGFGDIDNTDFTKYANTIDILTGGFPCQPYSAAGQRKGKNDKRHKWPQMFRTIQEVQPPWVVGENVRGLINWNGGMVFDEVQAELEAIGYEILPFLLPASSVNAPHQRYRIFFIAYSQSYRDRRELHRLAKENDTKWKSEEHGQNDLQFRNNGQERNATYTNVQGPSVDACGKQRSIPQQKIPQQKIPQQRSKFSREFTAPNGWKDFPTQSPVYSRNDGISYKLDGITFSKWRNNSIKAHGNAVVPGLVMQIFKAIEQYEKLNPII